MWTGKTPLDWVSDDDEDEDEDEDEDLVLCRLRLQRVEALLSLQWHPFTHILFLDSFKRGVTVFRVGTLCGLCVESLSQSYATHRHVVSVSLARCARVCEERVVVVVGMDHAICGVWVDGAEVVAGESCLCCGGR